MNYLLHERKAFYTTAILSVMDKKVDQEEGKETKIVTSINRN